VAKSKRVAAKNRLKPTPERLAANNAKRIKMAEVEVVKTPTAKISVTRCTEGRSPFKMSLKIKYQNKLR
jgi:hypothetical protein